LHPQWVQKYELGTAPVVFEVELEAWLAAAMPAYREVSRFPSVTRDLALTVTREQPAEPLLGALRSRAPAIVSDIRLFDLYQGKGLPEGQKSLAFRIVMQHTDRTLEDAEVEAGVAELIEVARKQFGAILRA
jgi:phenylalanyl-tRNA synthetase beta chain